MLWRWISGAAGVPTSWLAAAELISGFWPTLRVPAWLRLVCLEALNLMRSPWVTGVWSIPEPHLRIWVANIRTTNRGAGPQYGLVLLLLWQFVWKSCQLIMATIAVVSAAAATVERWVLPAQASLASSSARQGMGFQFPGYSLVSTTLKKFPALCLAQRTWLESSMINRRFYGRVFGCVSVH